MTSMAQIQKSKMNKSIFNSISNTILGQVVLYRFPYCRLWGAVLTFDGRSSSEVSSPVHSWLIFVRRGSKVRLLIGVIRIRHKISRHHGKLLLWFYIIVYGSVVYKEKSVTIYQVAQRHGIKLGGVWWRHVNAFPQRKYVWGLSVKQLRRALKYWKNI